MVDLASVAPLFVVFDAAAAVLTLVVAGFFVRVWRRSGDLLHLLFALGFTLVALGFTSVSTSEFDLARPVESWDAVRIAGHTGGALVLLCAYLGVRRHGSARPWVVLGWSSGLALTVVMGLYLVAPPYAELPALDTALAVGHAVQFLAYVGCAVMAFAGYRRSPGSLQALVPSAFLAWAFSKYTWLAIDLTSASLLVPWVFAWRFLALALLLVALAWPVRLPPEVAVAEA